MERLFKLPLYSPAEDTGRYNERFIVQLTKNYRSHDAILNIPNKLFYDGKLEAEAPKSKYLSVFNKNVY